MVVLICYECSGFLITNVGELFESLMKKLLLNSAHAYESLTKPFIRME